MCREFRCLPSAVYAEDAEVFRLKAIVAMGTPEREEAYADGSE